MPARSQGSSILPSEDPFPREQLSICKRERLHCIDKTFSCRNESTRCGRENVRCRRGSFRCSRESLHCARANTRCACKSLHCTRESVRCRCESAHCGSESLRCSRNSFHFPQQIERMICEASADVLPHLADDSIDLPDVNAHPLIDPLSARSARKHKARGVSPRKVDKPDAEPAERATAR